MTADRTYGSDVGESMMRGMSWTAAGQLSSRLLQFVVTAVLARLLLPEDLGLAGMALIVTGFLSVIAEFGMYTAVVQQAEIERPVLSAALAIVLSGSVAVAFVSYWSSGLVSTFFRSPELVPILQALSFTIPLWALGIVHSALLAKQLRFSRLAVAELAGSISYGVVAIGLAASGAGVWSLVVGNFGLAAVRSLSLWLLCRFRPVWPIDVRGCRNMLSYGSRVLGSNTFGYFRANVDYAIIGRFMGAAPLGVYTIAFKIADFPKKNLASIVHAVAFPAFAGLQHDREALKYAYLKTLRLMILYVAPVLVGMAVLAEPFILTIYGDRWAGAVVPLQLLVVMGLLLCLAELDSQLILACGAASSQLRYSVVYALAVTALCLAAVPLGINGIAAGVLAGTAVFFVLVQRRVGQMIRSGVREYFAALRPAIFASISLAVTGATVEVVGGGAAPIIVLCLGAFLGAVAYLATLRLMGVDEVWITMRRATGMLVSDFRSWLRPECRTCTTQTSEIEVDGHHTRGAI